MGSARSSQVARETVAEVERRLAAERKERELHRKAQLYEAQLVALKGQYETEREAILRELEEAKQREKLIADHRLEIARMRQADSDGVSTQENGAKKARKGAVK